MPVHSNLRLVTINDFLRWSIIFYLVCVVINKKTMCAKLISSWDWRISFDFAPTKYEFWPLKISEKKFGIMGPLEGLYSGDFWCLSFLKILGRHFSYFGVVSWNIISTYCTVRVPHARKNQNSIVRNFWIFVSKISVQWLPFWTWSVSLNELKLSARFARIHHLPASV